MPPPRRSYATPEETFGITRKPLNDWLDFAASGLPRQGPAFSTELEDANIRNQQRELQSMQLQRDLASEQAASQFLSQAAGKNPQGLMRMLAESPEILGSKDAPMIQDYVSQRKAMQEERQAKQPLSNRTLGPAIAKSITDPMERMRFQQMLDDGMEAADAYQGIQQERKTLAAEQELSKFEEEVASSGVPMDAILAARSLPVSERRLALASEMGRVKSAGKGGTDGELSISQILELQSKNTNDFGEPVNPKVAAYLDAQLERAMAPRNASANPSTGAVIPDETFNLAAEQARLDAARADDEAAQAVVAPAITRKPLGAFEVQGEQISEAERIRNQAEEAARIEKQRDLENEWTSAKDKAVAQTGVTGDIPVQRITNLAQSLLIGESPEIGTKQEREIAQKLADYAARAAEGGNVATGFKDTPYGRREVLRSPGFAFIEEIGGNPTELIEVKGSSIFGTGRKIPAYQLMDMRLQEIASPLKQLQTEAKAEARAVDQMTPEAMNSYEKLKAAAQGLTPNKP